MTKDHEITRRGFLSNAAKGGAALAIMPRHVLGRGFTPPSDKLNIAGIGVGGMGRENMVELKNNLPKAKRYTDFREMLDKQKDIEGVVVATPDHMHATIALAAMDAGKHVYVQKPLCWCVDEARRLSRRAQETKLATQ